ncbi:MAG: alkaline phytoceramidase [Nitrospiraceae bacterium]
MAFLRPALLTVTIAGILIFCAIWPPIPQDQAYHQFADHRSCLGIPNCLNVLSNLSFAVAGIIGLVVVLTLRLGPTGLFLDPWERWPYVVFFIGAMVTTLGSGYYHLAPDNWRLVWDRLPMTLVFMGLLTAMIAERVGLSAGRLLLSPLVAGGLGSVLYWYWTELHGAGDLKAYIFVQYGSLGLLLLLILLYPARYSGTGYVFGACAAYVVAKGLEAFDQQIFAVGHMVGGHTLKHGVAAGGIACIAFMLRARRPCEPSQQCGAAD